LRIKIFAGGSHMRPEERQEEIVAHLRALQSEVGVEELAALFKVSPLTIRRDLEQLERLRAIIRTHGGCVLRTTVESVYHRRVSHNFKLKQAIGRAAAEEVTSGNMILINDGSTPFHLAAHLGDKKNLSVYTNSMAVVAELTRFSTIQLYILGGQYNSAMHYMGGTMTEQILEGFYFDSVFMGADAVDSKGNCLVADPGIASLTQAMLRRGKRKILLADHTKVEAFGHAVYAKLSDLDVWYTTSGINPTLLNNFRKQTLVKAVNF
jgi:DeoR/GlpR family transcriptional regulator of sugar metabolism